MNKTYFDRWAENLYLGINDTENGDDDDDDAMATTKTTRKERKTIPIQLNGGYQNEFLFAERQRLR